MFWERLAFFVGLVLAAFFMLPWPFLLSSWWSIPVFLAWPAFIWVISR